MAPRVELSQKFCRQAVGGSDPWAPFYTARRMIDSGIPVVELTIGDHDMRTDPEILQSMYRSALRGRTGYTVVRGIEDLRVAVAKRIEDRTGVPTSPVNILITCGAQTGLLASHIATLNAGDIALYSSPYYPLYPGVIRAAGGRAVDVPTNSKNAFNLDAGDIDAAAGEARSFLMNSPNNPTGAVYPRRTLEEIAEVARRRRFWVISDEVYETQIWEGEHFSIRAVPGMVDQTIVVGSMSKGHAMTGSRIGWLVVPEEVVPAFNDLLTIMNFGVPEYIQEAAVFALEQGRELERKVAAPFARRRKLALDILAKQQLVGFVPPSGAMYMMLDIRSTGLGSVEFASRLLETEKIAVMPGDSFGSAGAGHIRIAMTVMDEIFEDALTRVLRFAEKVVSLENRRQRPAD